MVKVSCIVPVYNSCKYLRRMLDSILGQSFNDFELILIDDGSTDSSGEICDEYASKDSKICVYHKENGGVSSARNLGLSKAEGKYIIFMDSDDLIAPNMLQALVTDLESNDADIAMCEWQAVSEDFLQDQSLTRMSECEVIPDPVSKIYKNKFMPQLVNKLIKRDILGKQTFDEGINYSEDYLFVSMLLLKTKSLTYRKEIMYFYITHKDSLSWRKGNYNFWEGYIRSRKFILEEFRKSRFREQLEKDAYNNLCVAIVALFRFLVHCREKAMYEEVFTKYGKQIREFALSADIPIGKKIEYLSFVLSYRFACMVHKKRD